ncbi:MAG: hypothetical protein U5K74_12240 [Gemmatimonadaceae bacterium]|nr:hypothetical protein [Gemmatimonadaceae bacterium]
MRFSPRPPEKRSPGAIAISVALHLVIGAVVLRAVVGSNGIAEWLIGPQGAPTREKIELVAVRPPVGDASGGGAPENGVVKPAASSASRPLVPPATTPTVIPENGGGRGGAGGGTGSGYGTGSGAGVSRGVVPGYDPRLYPGVPEPVRVVRTPKERIDSVIAERFAEYADSVAGVPRSNVTEDGRADLTFTRNGKKYGWSQRGIVLGNITLPAPLLALLPLNRVGSNPSSILRQENPWAMRNQIQAGAQVAINAETFNERVKRIRERRDRERKEAREGTAQPPAPIQQQPQQNP